MSVLTEVIGMGASLVGGGGIGFIARLGMQGLEMWKQSQVEKRAIENKKLDHAHELSMLKENRETALLVAAGKLKEIEAAGAQAVSLADAQGWVEAQKRAFAPTGIKVVDVMNGVLRPGSFILILAIYSGSKVALWRALFLAEGWVEASLQVWTPYDAALLGSAWGFLWASREIMKDRAASAR